jgi:hypothetical protein
MKGAVVVAAALAAGLATAGITASGSAQAPGTRTLSLFENDAAMKIRFVDNPPTSPTRNFGSPRFRVSAGDRFNFVVPLLDRRGGKRAGTLYGEATNMQGRTLARMVGRFEETVVLADGSQI